MTIEGFLVLLLIATAVIVVICVISMLLDYITKKMRKKQMRFIVVEFKTPITFRTLYLVANDIDYPDEYEDFINQILCWCQMLEFYPDSEIVIYGRQGKKNLERTVKIRHWPNYGYKVINCGHTYEEVDISEGLLKSAILRNIDRIRSLF